MAAREPVTQEKRRKSLSEMPKGWRESFRKPRVAGLDGIETAAGRHRKSRMRLIPGGLERKARPKPPGHSSSRGVDAALPIIAERLDYRCAERLETKPIESGLGNTDDYNDAGKKIDAWSEQVDLSPTKGS